MTIYKQSHLQASLEAASLARYRVGTESTHPYSRESRFSVVLIASASMALSSLSVIVNLAFLKRVKLGEITIKNEENHV